MTETGGFDFGSPTPPKFVSKNNFLRYLFICVVGGLLSLPLLGCLFRKIFSLVCLQIVLLHQNNNYQSLYKLIAKVLKGNTYRSDKRADCWWFLMRLAVAFVQEQQIKQFFINPELEEFFIDLGKKGPGKQVGYNVAYSFVGFSLWLFERGLIKDAIGMIQVAENADPTWGYPQYLHGWYGLFLEDVDSVDYFSKAVNIDWKFLHRLRNDHTCQQFPEIVKQVNKRVLIQNDLVNNKTK